MRVLITGADGFIGKNLKVHLNYLFKDEIKIYEYTRQTNREQLKKFIQNSEFIFHLAGENRPDHPNDFIVVNAGLTQEICDLCFEYHRIPIIYTSSKQVELDNDYGKSKLLGEEALKNYAQNALVGSYIYRLPNIFGKWAKPNYNSFIATMCHNIANGLDVKLHDEHKKISLNYIDDVVKSFIDIYKNHCDSIKVLKYVDVKPLYTETLGHILNLLESFKENVRLLKVPQASFGFERALYATYMSYLKPQDFSYIIPNHSDERGSFYEVLKTIGSGQVSISTTKPGVTRGNHFHHTKNEKFLVLCGEAIFKFRHIITNETFEIYTNDIKKQIVEVPVGYTHNFTNIGDVELIMLLWSNETFDANNPDTYFLEV